MQRIGSIDRRAQSSAGTIVVGRRLRSAHARRRRVRLPPCAPCCPSAGKIPVPAMRKLRSCTRLDVGRDHDRPTARRPSTGNCCASFRREGHALGRHHHEVLHVGQRLGREAGFAAVRHVIGDLELRLAGTQRIGEGVMILLRRRAKARSQSAVRPGPWPAPIPASAPSGSTISKVPLSSARVRGGCDLLLTA